MLRSILIRIHMSRIIVYLDRDLNIFQAPRGAAGQPRSRIPPWQIEMDSISIVRNNDDCGNGFECPDVGHDVRSDTVQRRGKESWRRRRLLNADVEICRPMQSHGASLIVSTESLYSPDLSLNDSSCWNYCRGKGTLCSHLLHMYCTHLFSSHRVHTSKGNERSE